MEGLRVLHTGDWHIGSYPGPDRDGENARFLDICKCLDALVEGAKQEEPDVIVIAGDVFHQARVWSDRGLKENQTAVRYIRELREIAHVVVLKGTPNHDSSEQFNSLKTAFQDDFKVHIITEPVLELIMTASGPVQMACIPGFDRGIYRAKHPGLSKEEENLVFTDAVEKLIIGLKAQTKPKVPAVLVSHFTITGANMESGQTAFFAQFEPVVYPATLKEADYDLVCFGHIHRPQQLDGCENTFYCGAVSQLNFNDELQERGYYIHDIWEDGTGRTVKSRFCPLPSRQFCTITLKDGEVKEINENGPDCVYGFPFLPEGDVEGMIVRVLYDCTDEHNKAFNHAELEDWLYKKGNAFWVQEITPRKISVSVDKKGMDADNTPEDNLREYLEGAGHELGEILQIMELARPIISEATEKAKTERSTGAFVPVEIEVKNYRNYRDETFNFEDVRFCTINGSNGVGKSSLFMDAMVDCLFEETREGELTGWICNDPEARSGMIKFTFRLGEKTFRVTRTRQKSGKATLNLAELVDGEWVDRSKEKFRDTQEEIENTIGMDSLTLKACALIMQDQYGIFLQADKEARMTILGNILGLGIYSDMEEIVAARATDVNREIRRLEDQASGIAGRMQDSGAIQHQIEQAEKGIKAHEEDLAAETGKADALKIAVNAQRDAQARIQRLEQKEGALKESRNQKEEAVAARKATEKELQEILDQEPEITKGAAEYQILLEKEKEMIEVRTRCEALESTERSLCEKIGVTKRVIAEAEVAMEQIRTGQEAPIKAKLDREEELEEKHLAYHVLKAKLEDLKAKDGEYVKNLNVLKEAEKDLADIEHEYKTGKAQIDMKLESLTEKAKLLEDSGCNNADNATCRFLADARQAKAQIPQVKERAGKLKEDYQNARREAETALNLARTACNENYSNRQEIVAAEAELGSLEKDEAAYKELDYLKSSYEVIQNSIRDKQRVITDNRSALAEFEGEMEQNRVGLDGMKMVLEGYRDLKEKLEAGKAWAEKERSLPAMKENLRMVREKISELEEEIRLTEKELEDTAKEIRAAKEQLESYGENERKLDDALRNMERIQGSIKEMSSTLGWFQKQLQETREQETMLKKIREQLTIAGAVAAAYEAMKRAFSQDGIPHNVIRSIIPVFEATATNILGQMSGGHMSVEFVTEKVLKSNSKKEVTTLDIIINDADTGRLPYMSRSGGERVKAALSVILALAEIKSSKAGVQMGFLFIDEAPFLDAEGTQAYVDALEAIQKRYADTKIMAITHDETFRARFPQSITVYKDETGSHIRYE